MNNTKQRILIVDDIEALRMLMVGSLTKAGFLVAEADNGEEGLRQMASFKPDLVVLDVMMPGLHGVDVLKQLHEQADPKPKVVICTARDFAMENTKYIDLGAEAVIVKPFVVEEFVVRIKAILDNSSLPKAPTVVHAAPTSNEAIYKPEPLKGVFFKFWGTRGSIPVSNASTLRHGGNTSCFSIESGEDLVVIDAGTGLRELGIQLMKGKPRRVHLFITHTHWDHIQGFPFFTPAYVPGWEIIIYGASGFGKELRSIFRGQLDQDYFPVQMEDMRAKLEFKTLTSDIIKVGPFNISWEYVHHPGATVGYRIDIGDYSIGYSTDNEFAKGYLGDPAKIPQEMLESCEGIFRLFRGLDLLIHEAQYTNEEYAKKIGWGHCSLSNACLLVKMSGALRWIIPHHDPMHDDDMLRDHLSTARQELFRLGHSIPTELAYDGYSEYLS
jgi:CheY-like chemotaxis protein